MPVRLYDPTAEPIPYEQVGMASRPRTLEGMRLGLLENRKRNSKDVLERLGRELKSRYGIKSLTMRGIPTGTLLSERVIAEVKQESDVVILGVGD